MKDEILKIVYDPKTGFNECADQLTALMCYREVRAFMNGRALMVWCGPVIELLKDDYPKQLIMKAIEQVKKEMK